MTNRLVPLPGQPEPRHGRAERITKETNVKVHVCPDGIGATRIDTGLPFFDHMLEQLGRHARFDLEIAAKGDLEVDAHHTVEDVGLALGEALKEALGDKAGIRRYGMGAAPMDEALVEAALDISGRAFIVHDVDVPAETIGSYDTGLTEDFMRAFATAAGITLHVRLRSGRAPHHVVESEFKAVARALGDACTFVGGAEIPSTKGTL